MTAHELRREISDLVALLAEIGLVARSNAPTILDHTPFRWVTWAGHHGHLPRGGETVSEYWSILRDSEFTCVLADGGVIQISYALRGQVLEKHRFVWIPAPVAVNVEDARSQDIAELVEEGLYGAGVKLSEDDDDAEDLRLVTPVRFDYDRLAQKDGHPACHLTINRHCCRIPVFGPLSLGHFIRFVFRHFYPTQWDNTERLRDWKLRYGPRLVTLEEECEMFLDSRHRLGILGRVRTAASRRRF